MSGKSVNWTREQRAVIESRGTNLLVSAAAGSGKTAVLVERIIQMVTQEDRPLDIDKLLVMTFTNAAAAEMRERIGAAIEQRLAEDPENEHLQIQETLVHHAQITTIDSFCLSIIRNHFNLLDLDPSFQIGDEGELTLLRADVMKELLEDYYENGGLRFERFVETYASGKGDAGIEEYIMQVYAFSQSNPYPDQWIDACRKELEETGNPKACPPWMDFLVKDVRRQAEELLFQMTDALELCCEDEYLCAYAPMFEQDLLFLRKLCEAKDYEELCEYLLQVSWARLATVRSKEVDMERKTYVTGCRDRMKKAVGKMQELYCFANSEEMEADLEGTREPVEMLLELSEEFAKRFSQKKRDRNLVDFNDLEHEALKVLLRFEDGKIVYTEAADELSSQFEEVLVDEYQDSNLVQEALIHAVSRERFGQYNVFMVGDVKQSIYKFRLARPELFLEKYDRYESYEEALGTCRKIELHQNFRSRPEVLHGINDVFYRIMTENLGNIRYTENTALHPGAVFAPLPEGRSADIPELLLVDTGDGAFSQLDEESADYTAKELEAKLIAGKIREMTDPVRGLLVWDKKIGETGGYRRAQYRDMVILLRSTAGWTETILSVLMNEGIPAYAESRMGYFNTIEVEVILSLLAVIDNPIQDIPLASVLKSPIVGMSDRELAEMTAVYRASAEKGQDRGIYGAMQMCLDREEDLTRENSTYVGKVKQFALLLQEFRIKSAYIPIHELIYQVYERTGYYYYAAAMPAGETRKANLDMLVEKAAAYERSSYKGLFNFIRYIENLKKYNTDFGEATTVGEEDNTVRIMSIHKSKGLEFPVVFLAGMGKKFNRQDVYGKLLIDPELGIGTDYFDLKHRLKTATLKKNVLRRKMDLDNLGEELRVLYVAMTRAKEKLVMTGTDRYLAKSMEKYLHIPLTEGRIPYTVLSSAGSYLDWMLMSAGSGQIRIRITEIPVSETVGSEMMRQIGNKESKEALLNLEKEQVYDDTVEAMLQKFLNVSYPFEADIRLNTKMSVSELKKQGQQAEEETVQIAEIKQNFAAGGSLRGTAVHRALQLLPFQEVNSSAEVEGYLRALTENKRFQKEYLELIDSNEIWRFLSSPLGKRMRLAEQEGRLHKEQQFVIGIPAREMGVSDSEELVVVQGIIDAYIDEADGIVLVDYKTDRVSSPQVIIDHYKNQLKYYEKALVQITGKKVKEKIIYSMTLQRELYL